MKTEAHKIYNFGARKNLWFLTELSCKCPNCRSKGKHIIRGDEPSGSIIGVGYIHTGSKVPKGSSFRCTECKYAFKEYKI